MHDLGLFHFDLKLENIMIDGPLELALVDSWVKIVDFGWTQKVERSDQLLRTFDMGTESINPPEIHYRKPFRGEPVDVF